MTQKVHKYLFLFLLVFFSAAFIFAEGGNKQGSSALQKAVTNRTSTLFNVNDISTWIYNNGDSDLDINGNSGLEFPKGSGKTAVFETGFVWGGKVGEGDDADIRFGGSTYNHGIKGGAILSDGTVEDQDQSRIFRVRNDWETCDLTNDMAKLGYSESELRSHYEQDWNEWPASKGAPYEDVDGNGSYDPSVDIPGVPGADQTIWFVANDQDEAMTQNLYGALPFGVEVQATFWGYNTTSALGKMMFRKYMLINKTDVLGAPENFSDMYVSIWSDVDLGGAGDDFSGVDVDLSLAYTYNGAANDEQYGAYPPAIGFDFFQGPMIPGEPTDTAIFNLEKRGGFKNMPASAHYFFINGDNTYSDPPLGDYQGSIEFYNLVRGRVGTTGELFAGPPPNDEPTPFALAGDPLTQTGWVDGLIHQPGDRRQGMASGPFNMAAGDTQDIVVAEIAAGGFAPVDRLGAVGLLKFYDESAQIAYDNLFAIPKAPPPPIVSSTELDGEIILSWYQDDERVQETEDYAELGFNFEGYCVYQFPYRGATVDEAKLIATYDLNNGTGKVFDQTFDAVDGVVYSKVVKFGTDSGVRRYISIKNDAFKSGAPLLNGSEYFFAVTSYAVHEDVNNIPRVLENPLQSITVMPQAPKPGVDVPTEIGDAIVADHEGTGDASIDVQVVAPTELTGDDYQVYFDEQTYYLDVDGKWKPVTAAKGAHKDVSGSYLEAVAITSETVGTMNLIFTLYAESPNFAWIDGVAITLPDGIKINSAEVAETYGGAESADYEITDQTVMWGDNSLSEGGAFAGGEELHINVDLADVPFDFDYVIYDDGYAPGETGIVNAEGSGTIAEIGFAQKTVQHWNLKNTTTGKILLEDQPNTNIDDQAFAASPVVEGFQMRVNGNYAAPVDFDWFSVNGGDHAPPYSQVGGYLLSSFYQHGWATTAKSIDAIGVGTNDVNILQHDLEIRFTGEYEEPDANGVVYVKEGTGSVATIYNTRGMEMGDHPMNPNPGSTDPFTVRIPFEVWDVDADQQINIIIVDRYQTGTENPFYAFNRVDRMYCDFVNLPYTEEVLDPNTNADVQSNCTWNTVWFDTESEPGDVIYMKYANPIQLGQDKFTFKTDAATFSTEKESADLEEVNVFPNPYYGVNPQELNKYNRWVTFNHLPAKAEITIVNLGGQIVRKLNKEDDSQFLKWDLANENGLPVASGLYLAYVDMPEQGKTKILKVAIFQEQQVLDRF